MNFREAMKAVDAGKKVRRPHWWEGAYVLLEERFRVTHNPSNPRRIGYFPSPEDKKAVDWVVIK